MKEHRLSQFLHYCS